MKEAELIADQAIMISDGETVASGDPKSMLDSSPYRYRVVVEGVEGGFEGDFESLDLGDKKILYVRDMDNAKNILEMLSVDGSVKIERIGLEDIYLHIIRGVWDGV
jgi:ABC-type multidrug transport system ATPase subunit